MWIANAEQTRSIDSRAVTDYGVTSAELMERAGHAVFEAVQELLPCGGRITVFCGKGNNGGDGFVVARLAKVDGLTVDCLVAAEESDLTHESQYQLANLREVGVQPIFFSDSRWYRKAECVACRDLVVDALLGTGVNKDVCGPVLDAIHAINRSGVPVVSVDVPSGIHCDTGDELGESVWALRTVTFGLPKPYLFQGIGLEHAGYWTVSDIGYPTPLLNETTVARVIDADWVANLLPERLRNSHKGDNGSLLVVAGSLRMRGAATLVARAALRSGIGLVTVAGIAEVCNAVSALLPEAMVLPLPSIDGVVCADSARHILANKSQFDAAVFGPGMTSDAPVIEFLSKIWKEWEIPSVVDADALNAVSQGVLLPNADCVLTPHPGEMGRLLKSSIAEIQQDRFTTVEQAVARYGQCVLLKGPYSVVGDHGEPLMLNNTGNPGMATGGMGDTLSGIIGSLLAQDLPPYLAASCGMYWHGASADICAREIGSVGYSATDVANFLPKARSEIVSLACDSDFCLS